MEMDGVVEAARNVEAVHKVRAWIRWWIASSLADHSAWIAWISTARGICGGDDGLPRYSRLNECRGTRGAAVDGQRRGLLRPGAGERLTQCINIIGAREHTHGLAGIGRLLGIDSVDRPRTRKRARIRIRAGRRYIEVIACSLGARCAN